MEKQEIGEKLWWWGESSVNWSYVNNTVNTSFAIFSIILESLLKYILRKRIFHNFAL